MAAHQIPFWDVLRTESFGSSRQVKGIRARSPQRHRRPLPLLATARSDGGQTLPHRNPLASRFTAADADLPAD